MTRFFENLRPLLDAHLGEHQYKVTADKEYLGNQGATVELVWGDLRIRLIHERMFDFDADVSTKTTPNWYRLLELLVISSGDTPAREKVLVAHSLVELGEFVRRLVACHKEVVALLSPGELARTELRLAKLREETRHPMLK